MPAMIEPPVAYAIWSPPWYQTQPLCGTASAKSVVAAMFAATSAPTTARGVPVSTSHASRVTARARRKLGAIALGAVPGHGALDPFTQRNSSAEAEERLGARGVELS